MLSPVALKLTHVSGTVFQASGPSTIAAPTDAAVSDLYASSVASSGSIDSAVQSIDDFFATLSKKKSEF